MIVGNMAGLLQQSGIESEIRNDILGGATGELAPGETWVELWVDESYVRTAEQLIKDVSNQPERDDWMCNQCQESNPATFDLCWQCGEHQ